VSEYAVEDRKQVAEFDPSAFIDDELEYEEDPVVPCPICNEADNEDVLLLCDGCDAPYHTYCLSLDGVPRGRWFCMECAHDAAVEVAENHESGNRFSEPSQPRTLASERRNRVLERADDWIHRWGELSRNIHRSIGIDVDFEDGDQQMADYRSYQHRRAHHRIQRSSWRERRRIAERQGATNVFHAIPPLVVRRAQRPVTPVETIEAARAWGAFERAKDIEGTAPSNSNRRKRKSPSRTASPAEPAEPERKLKRPRTRKVPDTAGPSSASSIPVQPDVQPRERPAPIQTNEGNGEPSFLLSLLNEVQMNHDIASSDDDSARAAFQRPNPPNRVTSPIDYSSPVSPASPASSYRTSRATSTTPPPQTNKRSRSPLPLTSRVEPLSHSNYSPNRSPPPTESREKDQGERSNSPTMEIRQPRPRRRRPEHISIPRSKNTSPVRATMSIQEKEGINQIVKSALAPHWKSAKITKEQYADINRDVSRKLYEVVAEHNISDEKEKHKWERIATIEVETAVKSLTS